MIRLYLIECDTDTGELTEILQSGSDAYLNVREKDGQVRLARVRVDTICEPDDVWPYGAVVVRVADSGSRCNGWLLTVEPADLSALLVAMRDPDDQLRRCRERSEEPVRRTRCRRRHARLVRFKPKPHRNQRAWEARRRIAREILR